MCIVRFASRRSFGVGYSWITFVSGKIKLDAGREDYHLPFHLCQNTDSRLLMEIVDLIRRFLHGSITIYYLKCESGRNACRMRRFVMFSDSQRFTVEK